MKLPAEKLNKSLTDRHSHIFEFLSQRGRAIYFPHDGILGQSAAAKSVRYNATIGIAREEDNSPMRLPALADLVKLAPAKVFPYAPSFGAPELRTVWKDMILKKNPSLAGKSFSLPVVTQALTHGLSIAGFMFLNPGEEILIADPYWDNYELMYEESLGAKVTTFPCFKDDAGFNLGALESALDQRAGKKVVLLLNFPNNPTGYTPTSKEMPAILDILQRSAKKGTRLVVFVDDAYFGLVYEKGVATESIFAGLADMHPNILAVKIDGATKEDYVWGYRVGFLTFATAGADEAAYKVLADKAAGVTRAMISNCSQLSQSLLLQAYTANTYAAEKLEKYNLLKSRYEVVKEQFAKHREYAEVFSPLPYNSGYFMCIRLRQGLDAEKLRLRLIEKYDTGVINLSGLIRIAYSATATADIPVIFANIYKACKEQTAS